MTHCEIMHAVADRPEGPFKTTGVVIKSRKPTGWDQVNSHNPSVCVANGKIYLYYISNDLKGKYEKVPGSPYPSEQWIKEKRGGIIRYSQCTGVAVVTHPEGPFVRSPHAVMKPDNKLFKDVAVNPAVVYRDGRFLMIMKGDDPTKKKPFRIQYVGESPTAEGPFKFLDHSIYKKAQTEDACLWYNQNEKQYNMICHVLGQQDLIHFISKDGLDWAMAEPSIFTKKQIKLSDGTIWKPRRFERPFVLTDDSGEPIMLYVAIWAGGRTGNIAIPLQKNKK